MKIYCIETGKVKVKQNQLRKAEKNPMPGLFKVLLDKKWSEWVPIYCWLIEHEEGLFLVDTGETHKTAIKGYLPNWHPYYSTSVRFDVKPEDEIGPKLKNMGINIRKDISAVIMTHLHTDHAGGMYHFPDTRFLVDRKELNTASGLTGILAGYLPHRWPKWFNPELIKYENKSFGPFDQHQNITKDGRIKIIPTPGHVATHISVIAEADDIHYILAGDTSYRQDLMLEGIPDGVGKTKSIDTLKKIRKFTQERPSVYLPSHDPESRARLENNQIVPVYNEMVSA